jgi:hypothetical protein
MGCRERPAAGAVVVVKREDEPNRLPPLLLPPLVARTGALVIGGPSTGRLGAVAASVWSVAADPVCRVALLSAEEEAG